MRTRLCALPLEIVVETMRPLPVERVSGMPPSVKGLAIIRGTPTPVIDVACLLANETSQPTRFVVVRVRQRYVALAVDAVIGIHPIPSEALRALPALLTNDRTDAIAAVGALDTELLVVLESARLLSDDVWRLVDGAEVSS